MKLQQFTGGLATKRRPQFIGVDEAVVYNNIDSHVGTLAPVKAKEATAIVVDQFNTFYNAQQQWVSNTVLTDFLEFQKTLYSTDRVTRPQKFDGTNTFNLGITAPIKLTDFTTNLHPNNVEDLTVRVDPDAAGIPIVDTRYALVNVDSSKFSGALQLLVDTTGRVSVTAQNSTTVEPVTSVKADPVTETRKITLKDPKGIIIGGSGVEVYRLFQNKYYRVGVLATASSSLDDTVEDISGNIVLDNAKFGNLVGTLQYVLTYINSAEGVESAISIPSADLDLSDSGDVVLNNLPVSSDPQVDKKRIYRIGGNLTAFTQVVELANTTTSYTDSLKDTDVEGTLVSTVGDGVAPTGLSFLIDAYAMLFGAVGNKLRFTPVGEPDNWPALNFLTYEGDITGLASVANGVLVFTQFRTHLVTGTGPTSLSTQLLSSDQGCIAFESISALGGAAFWLSSDGICASSGGYPEVISKEQLGKFSYDPVDSLVHDEIYYVLHRDGTILAFDFGEGKIFKNFSPNVASIAIANDELYGWSEGILYKLFASATPESLSYTSPRFIEGRSTELKTYKKVYIYSKGDIIINIIINDVIVATESLSGENSHTIQIPQEKQRGFFIQFTITGTGEVYEVEYEVGRRHND